MHCAHITAASYQFISGCGTSEMLSTMGILRASQGPGGAKSPSTSRITASQLPGNGGISEVACHLVSHGGNSPTHCSYDFTSSEAISSADRPFTSLNLFLKFLYSCPMTLFPSSSIFTTPNYSRSPNTCKRSHHYTQTSFRDCTNK